MLSERPLKYADQKTERGKILNLEYSIYRDQPTSQASPLRIHALLSGAAMPLATYGTILFRLAKLHRSPVEFVPTQE